MKRALGLILLLLMTAMAPALAADLTADQVHKLLTAAAPNRPANLSGKSLESLFECAFAPRPHLYS